MSHGDHRQRPHERCYTPLCDLSVWNPSAHPVGQVAVFPRVIFHGATPFHGSGIVRSQPGGVSTPPFLGGEVT